MPIIANTTSGNTFSAVRAQLNSVTKRMNAFAGNESTLYANTINANVSLRISGTDVRATFAQNTYVKSVLANTNSYIAAQASRITLVNTNLTGTNTALRTLISDRLQVANAAATYLTKSNPTFTGTMSVGTRLDWAASQYAPPSFTTRSIGTKLNLYPAISGSLVDYAIGIDGGALWASVPAATSSYSFKWYGGETEIASISGTGVLKTPRAIINGVTAANGQLTVSGNTTLSGTLVANNTAGVSGYYLRTSGTGVYWSPVSASGGGANGFSGILVGANVISADSTTDRLTLVAGSGITLAANPTTDTITISSTASGAAANVVTKIVKDLTQNDTVVTSVSGVVVGSGITTGKAIAMAIVFGG